MVLRVFEYLKRKFSIFNVKYISNEANAFFKWKKKIYI